MRRIRKRIHFGTVNVPANGSIHGIDLDAGFVKLGVPSKVCGVTAIRLYVSGVHRTPRDFSTFVRIGKVKVTAGEITRPRDVWISRKLKVPVMARVFKPGPAIESTNRRTSLATA